MERMNVLICGGTGCTSSKSDLIEKEFNRVLEEMGLDKEVNVVKTGWLWFMSERADRRDSS